MKRSTSSFFQAIVANISRLARRRRGDNRRTWAARMLIILPSAHEGGEITSFKDGHTVSVSTSKYRQSVICWHKDREDINIKAPTKGNCLGLLYDLHIPRPIAINQLLARHHRAVQALQDTIEKYTVLFKKNAIENRVFFLPLKSRLPTKGTQGESAPIKKDMLLPSDLAWVECLSEKGMDSIRGFQTLLALATLTARDGMTTSLVDGKETTRRSSTKYILDNIVDTDGGDDLDEPLTHLEQEGYSEDQVLDVGAFRKGITRLVVSPRPHFATTQ